MGRAEAGGGQWSPAGCRARPTGAGCPRQARRGPRGGARGAQLPAVLVKLLPCFPGENRTRGLSHVTQPPSRRHARHAGGHAGPAGFKARVPVTTWHPAPCRGSPVTVQAGALLGWGRWSTERTRPESDRGKRNSEDRGRTCREKKKNKDVSMATRIPGLPTIFNLGAAGARTNHGKIEEAAAEALWREVLGGVRRSPPAQVANPQVGADHGN